METSAAEEQLARIVKPNEINRRANKILLKGIILFAYA
jgi:hypothetical protein